MSSPGATVRLRRTGLGLCLVSLAWLVMRGLLVEAQPASQPVGQQYLCCPECGYEVVFPADAKWVPTFCPRCGLKKVVMERSTYSRASRQLPPLLRDPLTASIIGTALVLALAFLMVHVRRKRQAGEARGEIHCDACRRKVVYSLATGGRRIPCPYCQGKLQLPGPEAQQPRRDAKVVKKWGAELRRQRDERRGRSDTT
jgi:DNA-directed RNA polymerase subunit RPC12/RpoP